MNVSSSEILNFIVATLQRKNEISPNKTFYLNIYFISNIFHLNIQNSNGKMAGLGGAETSALFRKAVSSLVKNGEGFPGGSEKPLQWEAPHHSQ